MRSRWPTLNVLWLTLQFIFAVKASTKAAPMHSQAFAPPLSSLFVSLPKPCKRAILLLPKRNRSFRQLRSTALCTRWRPLAISAALPPLDLTEENIRQVLVDARSEASISSTKCCSIKQVLLGLVPKSTWSFCKSSDSNHFRVWWMWWFSRRNSLYVSLLWFRGLDSYSLAPKSRLFGNSCKLPVSGYADSDMRWLSYKNSSLELRSLPWSLNLTFISQFQNFLFERNPV